MADELEYIRWLRKQIGSHPDVLVGPGDDCAVLEARTRRLLMTTDLLTEGVDFILGECGARAVGRKAMAVNLSDIAAMAGRPGGAVVSLALPQIHARTIAEEIFAGLDQIGREFDCPIVGGDTNVWPGDLVVSVTILGEATEDGAVTRAGARVGDWLLVTGPLGGSLLGRHLEPRPRIREAQQLNACADLHAMIDISDGLSQDLWHICEESGCGAELHADSIPIHPDAKIRSQATGKSALDHALGDGEDFELILAVSPEDGHRLMHTQPIAGIQLAMIGVCVEAGLWLRKDGARSALAPSGWVHPVG